MAEKKLFIIKRNLPTPLEKGEVLDLFQKMHAGDAHAKELLAYHNIRLVLDIVMKKYWSSYYDQQELVSIGNIGLVNAINTFDISRNVSFSTYATTCINNEIYKFLYHNKKKDEISLNKVIKTDVFGLDITLGDTLLDDADLEYDYLEEELKQTLKMVICTLPIREQYIINKYFEEGLTLEKISEELEVSRSATSQILNNALKKIGDQLEKTGVIEKRQEINARKRKKNRVKIKEKV